MSAREIIEQISALSDDDVKLIEAALRKRRGLAAEIAGVEGSLTKGPGRKLSHEEAMDYVFTEFAPVLAKLAQ